MLPSVSQLAKKPQQKPPEIQPQVAAEAEQLKKQLLSLQEENRRLADSLKTTEADAKNLKLFFETQISKINSEKQEIEKKMS